MSGTVADHKGYDQIGVFKLVTLDSDIDVWATNDMNLVELQQLQLAFA